MSNICYSVQNQYLLLAFEIPVNSGESKELLKYILRKILKNYLKKLIILQLSKKILVRKTHASINDKLDMLNQDTRIFPFL